MGGSSKPADPKVTPFQEPAPPSNPIPNFFGGQAGGGYKPNTGASQQSFTMPAQPQQAAPAMEAPQTPWQAPQTVSPSFPNTLPAAPSMGGAQPQSWGNAMNANLGGMNRPMMSFGIPTNMGGLHDRLMQAMGGGFGQNFGNDMIGRFQNNPNFLMDMFSGLRAPRNYTDTNPAQSTDAQGQPLFGIVPDKWRF